MLTFLAITLVLIALMPFHFFWEPTGHGISGCRAVSMTLAGTVYAAVGIWISSMTNSRQSLLY